jgi:hypothetical protein
VAQAHGLNGAERSHEGRSGKGEDPSDQDAAAGCEGGVGALSSEAEEEHREPEPNQRVRDAARVGEVLRLERMPTMSLVAKRRPDLRLRTRAHRPRRMTPSVAVAKTLRSVLS